MEKSNLLGWFYWQKCGHGQPVGRLSGYYNLCYKDGSGIYLLEPKFTPDILHLAYIQLISRNGAQMLQSSHATIMTFSIVSEVCYKNIKGNTE